ARQRGVSDGRVRGPRVGESGPRTTSRRSGRSPRECHHRSGSPRAAGAPFPWCWPDSRRRTWHLANQPRPWLLRAKTSIRWGAPVAASLAQLALAAALLATDCVVSRAEIESALERAHGRVDR